MLSRERNVTKTAHVRIKLCLYQWSVVVGDKRISQPGETMLSTLCNDEQGKLWKDDSRGTFLARYRIDFADLCVTQKRDLKN
jgi:hypothetical protein